MENTYSILGYIAAFCTTLAFLPQVLHTLKTNDTKSISLGMYILFVTGISFWLMYGLVKEDYPIILANAVTLLLSSTILFLKVRHQWLEKKSQL